MATFQSITDALRQRAAVMRDRVRTRDEARGYSIDKKRVVLAYLTESVVVAASLYGAWLFAQMYGHDDWKQIEMMLLAPVGYGIIEICRVPLALSVRTHESRLVKTLAIVGVICASGVTVKSMSQLGEIMFRPRLFDVVHAAESLQQANDAQTEMTRKIAVADALVTDRRSAFNVGEQRAKSDAEQLAALPKEQCTATSGVTKDGRPWKGQACKTDPRVLPMKDNLQRTVAARDDLQRKLEDAVRERGKLDPAVTDKAMTAAKTGYREAVLHSQLHSFTGMVFGKAPTEVTDEEIHRFLRLFVFFPAIFVAFASTLIAFTAVHRLEPKTIPFDPDAEFILHGMMQDVVDRATRRTQADLAKLGAKA
jgi:hypothetical protein